MPGDFTKQARIVWEVIPPHIRERLLKNVWCGRCLGSTTITDFTARVEGRSLVLRGQCITCRGKVARVIEEVGANTRKKRVCPYKRQSSAEHE